MSKEETKVQAPEKVEEQKTPETDTPEVSNEEASQEEKLLTQEQVNKLVQDIKAKEQKRTKKEVEEAREEAARLATLSQEEQQKEQDAKKRKEDDERERALAIRENTLTAKEELQKAGVPAELVGYVVDPDPEKTLENTEQFIEKYNSSVSNSVQERLKGQPPKDISSSSNERKDRKVITAF